MNREQFEATVLDLWVSTRIPLSKAHLQYHTGLSRQRLTRWLDELTDEGVLECDVDEDGEMLWTIPGAARSTAGPRTFAELGARSGGGQGNAGANRQSGRAGAKVRGSRGRANGGESSAARGKRTRDPAEEALESVRRAALVLAKSSGGLPARTGDEDEDENRKSVALSAGLSFLGPVGWLYAGSLREAAVATALAVLVWKLAPAFLLMPILWLALPLSAVVGLIYAWQYNRHGERTPIFLDGKKGDKKGDEDADADG